MAAPRLIFVEGITGGGKSTTAARVEEWLRERGVAVRRYHEMDDDNPIRTRGVDAMRANHPQTGRLPGTGPDGFARDPAVYAVEQWGRLARRANDGDETLILESRYLQNTVQPRFMGGAPREKVFSGFAPIAEQVAPARPLLVYLRPLDLAAHLDRTLAERPENWAEWFVESFGGYGWSKARGLTGRDAILGFYEEWERIAAELAAQHPGPCLWLEDPQLDWEATMATIADSLRG